MTKNDKEALIYSELADIWSKLSPPEDYAEEASIWIKTIYGLTKFDSDDKRPFVLDLGAGSGNNLSYLTKIFDAVAVDVSEDMLRISSKLNPGVEHVMGDMRNIRLQKTFDAVLIHDAVSYMVTTRDLLEALTTAREHLDVGGAVILGPDWIKGESTLPRLSQKLGEKGFPSYTEYAYVPGDEISEIELVFTLFIPQKNGRVTVKTDRHTHGFFSLNTWLDLIDEAGFEPSVHRYKGSSYLPQLLLTGIVR